MRSKKRRRNQSKRKRSRRRKGRGVFGDIGRRVKSPQSFIKGRIVGCKHFDKDTERYPNGNYNNLPYPAFLGAMLCRAAYEYDALFMHLLVFIFNLKQTQTFLGKTLKGVDNYKNLIATTLPEPTFKKILMPTNFRHNV